MSPPGLFAGLGDVLAPPSAILEPAQLRDDLAGFDGIVQFSRELLQLQLAGSLARLGINPLHASIEWADAALPPALLQSIAPIFLNSLAVREARLELRLVAPLLSALEWPSLPVGDAAGTSGGAMARTVTVAVRRVTVSWTLQVNILTARPRPVMPADGAPSPQSGPLRPPSAVFGDVLSVDPATRPEPEGNWSRSTIATGRVLTTAQAHLATDPARWTFGLDLTFDDARPTVQSDVDGVTHYAGSLTGQSLLARVVAPLAAAAGVSLSPTVAPGGVLSPSAVQRAQLPALSVRDILLTDAKGRPVLAFCVELAPGGQGALSLVQSLLGPADFAYAASVDLLAPALKVRWSTLARGLSFAGEVPVDLPAGNDPEVTERGRAQMVITLADTLDDVAIKPSADIHGDTLRLLTRQRMQLLNLWRADGSRVADLGDLAKPTESALALPFHLFDPQPQTKPINPEVQDFLVKLLPVVLFPLLQGFPANARSLSGYTSSALRATLVRWRLKSPVDDVRAPGSGGVLEVR